MNTVSGLVAPTQPTTLDSLRLSQTGAKGTVTPAAAIEYFGELAALGIDHAIVNLPDMHAAELFDLFATQILPEVNKMPAPGVRRQQTGKPEALRARGSRIYAARQAWRLATRSVPVLAC